MHVGPSLVGATGMRAHIEPDGSVPLRAAAQPTTARVRQTARSPVRQGGRRQAGQMRWWDEPA